MINCIEQNLIVHMIGFNKRKMKGLRQDETGQIVYFDCLYCYDLVFASVRQ
jgi:hypothetical protein